MIKESTQFDSISTSNPVPLSEKKPIDGASLDRVSKSMITRSGYTCRNRIGNSVPKSSPNARKMRTEELLCHLLSFSYAMSYEMARYLDMLTFSGRDYADAVAVERGWQIDYGVVDEYVSQARAISAKYKDK